MRRRGLEFQPADARTDFASGATPYVSRLLRPLHRGPLLEALRDGLLAVAPSWRRSLASIQARNAALVQSVLAVTGADVIVDSSKTGLRLKYLLRNPSLDVRVIRLIRDGRGVALTYMDPSGFADARDPTLRGGGIGRENSAYVMDMRRAAELWRRSNEEAEAVLRTVPPERAIRVRYEDLCRDTDATLARLFEFIGVDSGGRCRDFRNVEQHVVGNGMRFDTDSSVRLDDRWSSVLSAADLEAFERCAGSLNKAFGYA
jgi:hypothetical protein